MNATVETALLMKIKSLPPEQIVEVEDFVEFLSAKTRRQAALDRLLALAPALHAVDGAPLTEADIAAEIQAVRSVRRTRSAQDSSADRS